MKIYNTINNFFAYIYIKTNQLFKKYIKKCNLKKQEKVKEQLDNNIQLYQNIIKLDGFERETRFIKEKKELITFPYEFIDEYDYKKVKAWFDFTKKLYYVIHQNKRLYFPKKYDITTVKKVYSQLCMETDLRSPHSYVSRNFLVEKNNILFDVGAAEGIFTLTNIDKIKYGYLFEGDSEWLEPLCATFEPYKDKIRIVKKFVSDEQNENCLKLDCFVKDIFDEDIFVKIDVEGMEINVLNGATKLLASNRVKCACCTYHRHDDYSIISEFFKERNYIWEESAGVMLFLKGEQKPPYFRKGIIRATKPE